MDENLVFKVKLVWFGLVYFGIIWFLILQSVREVLVSIHNKFELSRYLLCPRIEINIKYTTNIWYISLAKFEK